MLGPWACLAVCQREARCCLETIGLLPIPTLPQLKQEWVIPPTPRPQPLHDIVVCCSSGPITSTLANNTRANPEAVNLKLLLVNEYLHC